MERKHSRVAPFVFRSLLSFHIALSVRPTVWFSGKGIDWVEICWNRPEKNSTVPGTACSLWSVRRDFNNNAHTRTYHTTHKGNKVASLDMRSHTRHTTIAVFRPRPAVGAIDPSNPPTRFFVRVGSQGCDARAHVRHREKAVLLRQFFRPGSQNVLEVGYARL